MDIKIIGMIFIILSGTGIGLYASYSLKMRIQLFENYISFISHLKEYIRFNSSTLSELLNITEAQGAFKDICKSVNLSIQCGKSFYSAWESAVSYYCKEISKEDILMIKEFGKSLGTTDIDGQIAHCQLSLSKAERRLSELREDYKTKAKLYRGLGVMGGIATVIFFI